MFPTSVLASLTGVEVVEWGAKTVFVKGAVFFVVVFFFVVVVVEGDFLAEPVGFFGFSDCN